MSDFYIKSVERQRVLDYMEKKDSVIIFLDTETTGFSPAKDVIIQFAAIKARVVDGMQLKSVEGINRYIKPDKKVSKKIEDITGITNEQLADAPVEADVFDTIMDFMSEADAICGHNVSFDIGFIKEMYQRNGHEIPEWTVFDTLSIARELHSKDEVKSFKQENLLPYFGLDYGLSAHNALDDVVGCMRLFRMFAEEYKTMPLEKPSEDKLKTTVVACWPFDFVKKVGTKDDGKPKYEKQFRLYVRVRKDGRVLWINQRRPYEWHEKTPGSLDMLDIDHIQQQVLSMYKVDDLEALSKVRHSLST